MRQFFDRCSLRVKLTLGFGAVLALMCMAGGILMLGHQRGLSAVERYFSVEDRVGDLSADSMAAMEKARRYESQFLLRVHTLPFAEAKARYANLVAQQLRIVRENLDEIRRLYRQQDSATQAAEAALRLYEDKFNQVVALYGQMGHGDAGLEGRYRAEARAFEALLPARPAGLRLALLELRRREKNFILAPHAANARAVQQGLGALQDELQRAALPAGQARQLMAVLERYRLHFDTYRNVVEELEQASAEYLTAVHRIEPELSGLRQSSADSLARTRATVLRAQDRMGVLIVLGGGLALALAALVGHLITRHIEGALALGVRFARQLAAGDWSARLPAPSGEGEFARLGLALNTMAGSLEQAHMREQMRSAELLRLNRTLRLLSRCNEALVQASGESHLLQAVCDHMLREGNYPRAWVADAGGRLLMQAGRAGPLATADAEAAACALRERRLRLLRGAAADGADGAAASLLLPLLCRGEVLGVLGLSSGEASAFDAAEIELLRELADDLALGLYGWREGQRRAAAEQALDYQLSHDALTGLANRARFERCLLDATTQAERSRRQVAVLVLSPDRYRQVKHSLGDEGGDRLLRHIAAVLAPQLRERDTLARLQGDEFAIVLGDLFDGDGVLALAGRLLDAVQAPLQLDGAMVSTTASIGICMYGHDGMDAASLLCSGNAAMASAQAMGGNRFNFYAPEMNERSRHLFAREAELAAAIACQQLCVHYQPRVRLASGAAASAEALVRWRHPERGMVAPSDFIPLAESTGLIVPLGLWVLREVCRQQRAWIDAGLAPLVVAVNLSPRQFREPDLVPQIAQALFDFDLNPSCLEMEVTESLVMDDIEQAREKLLALKALGIHLALDDFGTGHSSLGRLRDLPIDYLKIDQCFVRKLGTEAGDAAICKTIIGLAHNLGMQAIAEGVETEEQAAFLREAGCDEIQGYLYGRPMPAADLAGRLAVLPAPAMPVLA